MSDVSMITEEIAAVSTLAVGIKQIVKNGKNIFADLPVLMALLGNYAQYQQAVIDAPKALPEFNGIDQVGANQIVADVFQLVQALQSV